MLGVALILRLKNSLLYRSSITWIKNVFLDDSKLVKKELSTTGVATCWAVVVFLTNNYVYLEHITSASLSPESDIESDQDSLEEVIYRMKSKIDSENPDLEIAQVERYGPYFRAQ